MVPGSALVGRVSLTALFLWAAVGSLAQTGAAKRLQFARGHSSTTVEGSVVRGTRDRYLVGTKAGQAMTVRITSLERNAVFSIAQPDGSYLANATPESDATRWSGKLLQSGDYVIEVGGTRGNAKYALTLAIR